MRANGDEVYEVISIFFFPQCNKTSRKVIGSFFNAVNDIFLFYIAGNFRFGLFSYIFLLIKLITLRQKLSREDTSNLINRQNLNGVIISITFRVEIF